MLLYIYIFEEYIAIIIFKQLLQGFRMAGCKNSSKTYVKPIGCHHTRAAFPDC